MHLKTLAKPSENNESNKTTAKGLVRGQAIVNGDVTTPNKAKNE